MCTAQWRTICESLKKQTVDKEWNPGTHKTKQEGKKVAWFRSLRRFTICHLGMAIGVLWSNSMSFQNWIVCVCKWGHKYGSWLRIYQNILQTSKPPTWGMKKRKSLGQYCAVSWPALAACEKLRAWKIFRIHRSEWETVVAMMVETNLPAFMSRVPWG